MNSLADNASYRKHAISGQQQQKHEPQQTFGKRSSIHDLLSTSPTSPRSQRHFPTTSHPPPPLPPSAIAPGYPPMTTFIVATPPPRFGIPGMIPIPPPPPPPPQQQPGMVLPPLDSMVSGFQLPPMSGPPPQGHHYIQSSSGPHYIAHHHHHVEPPGFHHKPPPTAVVFQRPPPQQLPQQQQLAGPPPPPPPIVPPRAAASTTQPGPDAEDTVSEPNSAAAVEGVGARAGGGGRVTPSPSPVPQTQHHHETSPPVFPPRPTILATSNPLVYTAVYSGIPVYEMIIRGVPCMRRVSDSYVNATHILKVAGLSKPQRTKIMEREVLQGIHEKVQGGYGQYQGTWIPLESGRVLAKRYNVEPQMSQIFDFQDDSSAGGTAPMSKTAFFVAQAQAAKAAAAKQRAAAQASARVPPSPPAQVTDKSARKAKDNSNNAPAAPITFAVHERPTRVRKPPNHLEKGALADTSSEDEGVRDRERSVPYETRPHGRGSKKAGSVDPGARYSSVSSSSRSSSEKVNEEVESPATLYFDATEAQTKTTKASRVAKDSKDLQREILMTICLGGDVSRVMDLLSNPTATASKTNQEDAKLLLGIANASDDSTEDNQIHPTANPDFVIDSDGATALHWAATVGHVQLCQELVAAGASIFARTNNASSVNSLTKTAGGETPLHRAVCSSANYNSQNMPYILHLLQDSIRAADVNGRTVLHKIAAASSTPSLAIVSVYYAQCLIGWMASARAGPTESLQMRQFVNTRDCFGNTALHLAMQSKCQRMVELLLRMGADKSLKNVWGQSALDYAQGSKKLRLILKAKVLPAKSLQYLSSEEVPPQQVPDRLSGAQPEIDNILASQARLNNLIEKASNFSSEINEHDFNFNSNRQSSTNLIKESSPDSSSVIVPNAELPTPNITPHLTQRVLLAANSHGNDNREQTNSNLTSEDADTLTKLRLRVAGLATARKRAFEEIEEMWQTRASKDMSFKRLLAEASNVSLARVHDRMVLPRGSMRGLTVFIADLRNCRARELEEKRVNKELANIRSKFKDLGLNGYQKKKYVAKLIYMYILGWDIDFGQLEGVQLLQSPKYSEKQIGYLACTLLLNENSDLMSLVVNNMKRDLASPNEIHVCLALHAIANVSGREMAEQLSYQVEQLLVAGGHGGFVRKKAALCLLRLFRKHPDFFQAIDWAPKIINMMDDPDLGTALATTTLVTTLAQAYPEAYIGCVAKCINRLAKIYEDRVPSEYIYYKVPVPWLQVKLLRLLQYYPPPDDLKLINKLSQVLLKIVKHGGGNEAEKDGGVQGGNAYNAVLFEAINLCIHLDPESEIVNRCVGLLGSFISSKETNVRYLGLETMCHLAGTGARNCIDGLRVNQEVIIANLKDKDISVRRRAVDLLYSMCDQVNVRVIVAELLRYLEVADYAIRDEMVLKIAILTEKFAMEYSWYVDVVLQLITIAGEHVSDDIWFRVIQIITNNADLQEYAASTLLQALRAPNCHETTLKVGGYVLGEFGHLIANNPGCAPIDQFTAIHSKFAMCSPRTRALLLTSYIKFVNLFPEIKEEILNVFKQNRHVLDTEVQQRATEYLAVATLPTDDILQTVCEEMPAFPERESALVSRLQKQTQETQDKRTWVIGGKDANADMIREQMTARGRRGANSKKGSSEDVQPLPSDLERSHGKLNGGGGGSGRPSGVMDDATLFNRLMIAPNGLLHRDGVMEIGIKTEFREQLGRMAVFIGNRSLHPVANVAVSLVDVINPHGTVMEANAPITVMTPTCRLRVTLMQAVPAILAPGSQVHQLYKLECLGPRDDGLFPEELDETALKLKISYVNSGGSSVSLSESQTSRLEIRLPMALTKFVGPVTLSETDFFQRWKQVGGPPRESQAVFSAGEYGPLDTEELKRRITGLGFNILEGLDVNAAGIVGAGILSCADLGKVGCMIRFETNKGMYRCTVRTTNEVVSQIIRNIVEQVALLIL